MGKQTCSLITNQSLEEINNSWVNRRVLW